MHAVITFAAFPLFLGALLSDWAYASTYEIQWANFASWLIAAGLPFIGLALLWGALDLVRARSAGGRRSTGVYLLLLAAAFVLGFFNALVHARDGWAAMPTGVVLSVVVMLILAVASGIGLAGLQRRAA